MCNQRLDFRRHDSYGPYTISLRWQKQMLNLAILKEDTPHEQ